MTRISVMVRGATALAIAGVLLAGLTTTASAHETREVEGEFEFVVGFVNEPAYVNEMNGLELQISYLGEGENGDDHDDDGDHGSGEPVENAHESLRAAVLYAGETHELELRALWGEPGHYTSDLIPTSTGAYTFQIIGEIDGIDINETFQAGPDTFSEVEPRDGLEFPATSGGMDGADQAAAFGIAGVVAGLLGLAAGGAAYYKVSNTGGPNPAQRRREQRQAQQQPKSDE